MDESNHNTVVIEDEDLRAGYTLIPNTLFRWPEISPGAKLTFVCLLSYGWEKYSCFPGQETMARDMGCSVKSVQRYLKELEAAGAVRVRRRGLTLSNVYVLVKLSTLHKAPT